MKRLLILLFAFLVSCSPKCYLPNGNVKPLNTEKDELAPVSIPSSSLPDICSREFESEIQPKEKGVMPAKTALFNLLPLELIDRVEAATYYDAQKGFFALAHPPDSAAAYIKRLPFAGGSGGSDIIEFSGSKFTALPEPLNTITWDSHPFAVEENGTLLLVWSSDRADSKGGYSSPFLRMKSPDKDTLIGNTDLFYAFRTNGKWSEIKNLPVNSSANDETPFIYCLCHNGFLLFASNRENAELNDYDLYEAEIAVDFENQILEIKANPVKLPKGEQAINTSAKEFFPFIPHPYTKDQDKSNHIYFSSDRFSSTPCGVGDVVKNMGSMDIYRFPYERTCKAPSILYELVLLNEENPSEEVPAAYIQRISGEEISSVKGNKAVFTLDYGKSYKFGGGSHFDTVLCTGAPSVVTHYAFMKIDKAEPLVQARDTFLHFDIYDTIIVKHKLHKKELSKVNEYIGSNRSLLEIRTIGDSLLLVIQEVKSRQESAMAHITKISRKVKVYDTIPQFDTTYIKSSRTAAPSVKTIAYDGINFTPARDTLVRDTIYIKPRYFNFPPCSWEFVNHLDQMRKNVPYFQTGFWEVNTPENLNRHLKELPDIENASFIELHPQNQYFGYRRSGMTEEQQEFRRQKRANRIAEYQKFARAVDENLDQLVREITEVIIPDFEKVKNLNPAFKSKLVIRIEGWSDIRPIEKGWYTGGEDIFYISGEMNDENLDLKLKEVNIRPGVSLIGESNDTLSKLRAYFGYKEIVARLMKTPVFLSYYNSGKVILPDEVSSIDDFNSKFQNADIAFLVLGKQVDAAPGIDVNSLRERDFRDLDPIRRVNVVISRVQYSSGKLFRSECCTNNQE